MDEFHLDIPQETIDIIQCIGNSRSHEDCRTRRDLLMELIDQLPSSWIEMKKAQYLIDRLQIGSVYNARALSKLAYRWRSLRKHGDLSKAITLKHKETVGPKTHAYLFRS